MCASWLFVVSVAGGAAKVALISNQPVKTDELLCGSTYFPSPHVHQQRNRHIPHYQRDDGREMADASTACAISTSEQYIASAKLI